MRHLKDHRKLGRTAAHRKAMLRSMVTSLFQAERITTTAPKAKEARRVAEKLITRAKKGHRAHNEGATGVALAHWREVGRYVRSTQVMRKLFDQLAPLYMERNGGYMRIIRLDHTRVGDNAKMVMLELVDSEISKKPMMKGSSAQAVEDADEKAVAKSGRGKGKGKEAEASAEAKPKKEKKPKPDKSTKEKPGKPAKTKADTRKKDSGGSKKSGASKKSG